MTDPLEPIQQAAERLRSVDSSNDYRTGYGETPEGLSDHEAEDWYIVKEEHDQLILMKFALSILPKGERPVPVTVDSFPAGATAWLHTDQHGRERVFCWAAKFMRGDATCFASKEDAEADMRWDLIRMLTAAQ